MKDLMAEREGFEPPGLIGLPLSRRVHLSALPPFRRPTLPSRRIGERSVQETARSAHQCWGNTAWVIDRRALIERIAVNAALNARAHALVLAGQDRSWGTEVFALAGGHAVLCGPGLYVNRAIAVGLTGPMSAADFELLEQRSAVVGVPPAVDVTPTADASVIDLAAVRGYGLLRFLTTHVLPLDGTIDAALPSDPSIIVERADGELLGVWQDVSAVGFDVAEGDARRVNDAFTKAAAVVDSDGLLLASDAVEGRPLGCASVTIRDGLATLGGMATLPTHRRRGVQRALIAHRLRIASEYGCDLAVSSTLPASASERNLARIGFRPLYETVTLATAPRGSGSS
jgi:GNAT superfamily N-acetyltransferase